MSARYPLVVSLLVFLFVTAARGQQPSLDYSRLAEPSFADQLALTDEQRVAVADLLDQRIIELARAQPGERPALLADSNQKLLELLTVEQRERFASLLAGGKLQFDFRQQKWPEVLDWFAQQADLSLVMDAVPPGTLTYSDAKEYTPAEAIDLLNSVLLSKGFTLMRREKMLIVVDTSEGIPFEMAPRVSVEELADRGRFEIVTVEFALGGRPVDTSLAAVQELIGKHGRVTPLNTARKLIVTETAGKLRAINEVIAGIPIPKQPPPPTPPEKPPQPVFAVYPAPGLSPQATVQTLEELFPSATIQADPTAAEIHVYAVPAVQESVKTSVEKMIANVSGDNRTRLEIYALDVEDLESVQQQLSLTAPQAQISVDQAQQRLLVFANGQQHALIEETLETLGAARQAEERATVTIYPVNEQATNPLVTILQQILPRATVVSQPGRIAVRATPAQQKLAQSTIDQFQKSQDEAERPTLKLYLLAQPLDPNLLSTIQGTVPEATLTLLDDGRHLSVIGDAKDQARVATTLQQLRSDLPPPSERTLEIYETGRVPFAELQALLSPLVPRAEIRSDNSGQRVLVWAAHEDHEKVSATLQKIRESAVDREPMLETYAVPTAEGSAFLAAAERLAPQAQVSLDANNRRLIVIGSAPDQERIRQLVDKLAPTDQAATRVLIAYPLQKADAAAIVGMLRELRPDVQFAADTRAGRILVTAELREHPRLQAVIEQLDAAPDESRQEIVKPYRFKTADPAAVVQLLQPLVPEMRLSVDQPGKQVLAAGSEFDHQTLERAVLRIDQDEDANGEVQSYDIGSADTQQVRNVLMQLAPTAVISADPVARRVMVWADPQQHTMIQQAVEQFTRPDPDQTRRLEMHPISKANSATALRILQSVVPSATLSLDERQEQVIAWATPREQESVRQALRELIENEPQREDIVLRVHRGDNEVLRNAVQLLKDVAPEAQLLDSSDPDQWLVWANPQEQQAIADLLEKLTGEVADARVEQIVKAYPLGATNVALARQVLAAETRDATILDSSEGRRLVVRATAQQHAQIEKALTSLNSALDEPEDVLRVYPIVHPDLTAQTVLDYFDAGLKAGVAIQVESQTNSLIIQASEEEHQELQKAIDALVEQLPPKPTLHTQVFRFASGQPSAVLPVLQNLVPNARLAANDQTRTLAATASQEDLEQIQDVVEQLAGSQREFEVFHLQAVDPFVVQNAIFELFAEGPVGNAPSVSSDFDSQRLFVRGTASQINQIRQLLARLGEPTYGADASSSGEVRTIPFAGNTQEAVRQIEQIWSRLRGNRIQVITPSRRRLIPLTPGEPAPEQLPFESKEPVDATPLPDGQSHVPGRGSGKRARPTLRASESFVAFQQSTRAAAPKQQSQSEVSNTGIDETAADQKPSIVIVPGDGEITIASPDQEALDQLESLLRAMARDGGGRGEGANFAVFMLRNTGAGEMRELLRQLFDDLPFSRSGLGDVVLVADDRLNALIVHGNRKAREVMEELLEVLDSSELPDPRAVPRPELIRLRNTPAERVRTILENVYRTQLTSGGGRRQVPIPEGVSPQVASVLQQINAAAAGPLLTLDVDATTNSIVLRAPLELTDEIRAFVEQMDGQAQELPFRHVRVIRLENSKSDRMRAVLEQFLQRPE